MSVTWNLRTLDGPIHPWYSIKDDPWIFLQLWSSVRLDRDFVLTIKITQQGNTK